MRAFTVQGAGVDLAVTERAGPGPDAPVVVLVHGYPDTSAVWSPVADLLAQDHRVVTYDVRGAGASQAPTTTEGYALDLLVADMLAVADAVSPGRPVHLAGHDWGSVQGWAAVTDPVAGSRFASFTSISGPSLDHMAAWLRARRTARPSDVRALLTQGGKSWYVYAFHLPGASLVWRTGLARRWARLLEAGEGVGTDAEWPAPTLARDAANGVRLYRANVRQRLSHPRPAYTDVPVQLVVPTRDPFLAPALASGLDAIAPDLQVREVPAGHWVLRSRPAAVARWVHEHVEEVGGRGAASDEAATVWSAVRNGWGSEGGANGASGIDAPTARLDRGPGTAGSRATAGGRGRPHVVVVTGAASGIGRATAVAYAERGATVVAADVDLPGAERTVKLARAVGGDGLAHRLDVTDADAMDDLVKRVGARWGAPRVVVNNAGIGLAGPLLDTTDDDWARVLDVNLWGVIHGSRLFGRLMADYGEGGHIVNVASAAAFQPSRAYPAYATSKAAVLMLSECLRAEMAPHGVGVSAICPGVIDTNIVRRTRFVGVDGETQEQRRRQTDRLYRRRGFGPDRVAAAILDAVDRDLAVVPVSPEARLARLGSRLTPGLMRRLAAVDPTPR